MKKIVLLFSLLMLVSCALVNYPRNTLVRVYYAEELKTDYFEEWGLFRSTGYGIISKEKVRFAGDDSSFNKVCGDLFGKNDFFAGRIYQEKSGEKMDVECFWQSTAPINTTTSIGQIISSMLGKGYSSFAWIKNDSAYRILYSGDSVQIISGIYYNHRLVCAKTEWDKCTFDDEFERDRETFYSSGPFYEISLPATGRIRSLSIRSSAKNPVIYKPLKLDPSILPLESPGYKKLHEQEQALRRLD